MSVIVEFRIDVLAPFEGLRKTWGEREKRGRGIIGG
jgi:hypothetical protein